MGRCIVVGYPRRHDRNGNRPPAAKSCRRTDTIDSLAGGKSTTTNHTTAALLGNCAPASDARAIKKLGHITPSSNTTLEPLTTLLGLLAGGVSQHFARIPVQRLALDEEARSQFESDRMMAAARLLAEAPLDAIAWNGTSGSWLGIERDRSIVAAIESETGIRATTATLAMADIFERMRWTSIGVVCPYTDDITSAIVRQYERRALNVVATSNLRLVSNLDMGRASGSTIREQLVAVAAAKPDCIAVICTNLSALTFAESFEAEYGIPIVDSIAATFVHASRLCGVDVRVEGAGRLLAGS